MNTTVEIALQNFATRCQEATQARCLQLLPLIWSLMTKQTELYSMLSKYNTMRSCRVLGCGLFI